MCLNRLLLLQGGVRVVSPAFQAFDFEVLLCLVDDVEGGTPSSLLAGHALRRKLCLPRLKDHLCQSEEATAKLGKNMKQSESIASEYVKSL